MKCEPSYTPPGLPLLLGSALPADLPRSPGIFRDVTIRAGLGVETRYVRWGAAVADFDNDGLPDLFLRYRRGLSRAGGEAACVSLQAPSVLFRNLGEGRFEELLDQGGAGIHEAHSSRGAAFGDFDALLDDTRSSWRDVADVFCGAMMMQISMSYRDMAAASP